MPYDEKLAPGEVKELGKETFYQLAGIAGVCSHDRIFIFEGFEKSPRTRILFTIYLCQL